MLVLSVLVSLVAAQDVELLPYDALTKELHQLASEHEHVELISIGASRAGRKIEGLRFGTHDEAAPAILLVANLDGPRVFASGVALHHARRLAAEYGSDEGVQALLNSTVVYILPRGNPDAAELYFDDVRFEHRATGAGVDNDRDGRQGEDPAQDVNGDGVIASMRFEDPEGTWIVDPNDPRAMVEADATKGERGRWKVVVEGRDLDGDERVSEDAPLDALVNRNFASGWKPHTAEFGIFPTDEPATLALADFFVSRRDLVMVVTYDELDNLVKKPKTVADDARSVKRVPPEGVLESDGELIEVLGERYRELTGAEAEGGSENGGTFQRFVYDHRGLWTLNLTLWDLPQEDPPKPEKSEEDAKAEEAEDADEDADEDKKRGGDKKKDAPKPSDDAKHLVWIDAQGEPEAWRFLPWTPFEHPELGSVEIGGFAPFARLDPPVEARGELADKHFEHLLTLGSLLPRPSIAECTMKALGEGVWQVEAVVENGAFLPLQSRSARRTRTVRPASVKLWLPDAATLLAGRTVQQISSLAGSGGRFESTWLVQGPEGMEIGVSIDTDNAGAARARAEVTQ